MAGEGRDPRSAMAGEVGASLEAGSGLVEKGQAGTAGARSWSGRDLCVALVPAALLVVIAMIQLPSALGGLLSPWKGGGFGMFASLDSISNRPLRVFAEVDGQRRPVRLPAPVLRQWQTVRGFPSDQGLRRVARDLEDFVLENEPAATSLFVEVWRTEFEAQTSALRLVRWRTVRWDIDQQVEESAPIDLEGASGVE